MRPYTKSSPSERLLKLNRSKEKLEKRLALITQKSDTLSVKEGLLRVKLNTLNNRIRKLSQSLKAHVESVPAANPVVSHD